MICYKKGFDMVDWMVHIKGSTKENSMIPLEVKDDRIIGWIKKWCLTNSENAFCLSVYGKEELSEDQWAELSRINKKYYKEMQ